MTEFSFSTSKRASLKDSKGRPLSPNITHEGGFVVTPEGKRYAILSTTTDPFAADKQKDSPQTIEEVEKKVDRERSHRQPKAS